MTETAFGSGHPVSFKSLCSATVFHARVVRRLNAQYYLVEDRSGYAPRPVRAERLQADRSFKRWEGEAA